MKIARYLFCFVIIFLSFWQCTRNDQKSEQNINIQKNGLVSNDEIAKKIAETIWVSIYGQSVVKEKPYKATLIGDSLWIVEGTSAKENCGGVARIEIRKRDCKILKVLHDK